MYLIDANILIYSADGSSSHHKQSRKWLSSTIKEDISVYFSWIVILAFLRITTNQRIMQNAFSLREAFSYLRKLLIQPNFQLIDASLDLLESFEKTSSTGQAKGALIMDAYLATLAIENGLILCTQDKDFRRFDDLKLFNPIEAR